jgi:hypothetical protein
VTMMIVLIAAIAGAAMIAAGVAAKRQIRPKGFKEDNAATKTHKIPQAV